MSIVIIMLTCLLTILTYKYIRQRIVDKKNEELNQKANDAHIVKRREIVFSNVPSSQEETLVLRYIGSIEKYQDTPQGGDVGIYENYFYVFTECDGTWHLLPEYTYSKLY